MSIFPSPSELMYFYETASSGSLSKAALQLNITQPTLTMAIKRLEKMIGTELFYRNNTGMAITRAGEKLLIEAETLLNHWNDIKQQITNMRVNIKGKITIGCPTAMSSYLKPFISSLLNTYSDIEMNLKTDTSANITAHVLQASIDIGIVINPQKHANLVVSTIHETDFTFWNNDEKPCQQFNSCETVLIYDPDMPQATTLLKQLDTYNLFYTRLCKVNGLENVAHLALDDRGIAILPACFVMRNLNGKLKQIMNTPLLTNATCLIYRHENKDILIIKTVINELKKYIQENLLYQTKASANS